jgi:hypothetical protein
LAEGNRTHDENLSGLLELPASPPPVHCCFKTPQLKMGAPASGISKLAPPSFLSPVTLPNKNFLRVLARFAGKLPTYTASDSRPASAVNLQMI